MNCTRGEKKMEPQMEAMLERLKSVENMEQMINLEDEIAKALGHGFLKGILNMSI